MKSAGPIPLITLEEHLEAFYLWHHQIRAGVLAPSGNTLLHVDQHSDMATPHLFRPLDSISDLTDLADFTYEQLNIADFIWPAVYQGVFNRLLWVKHHHSKQEAGPVTVCATDSNFLQFLVSRPGANKKYANAPDLRTVEYAEIHAGDPVANDQPIVLDIDLDYFGSNEQADRTQQEIEVTRETYDQFVSNRYHYLKIAMGFQVTACVTRGKYYLAFKHHPRERLRLSRAEIGARMLTFSLWLRKIAIQPVIITVCRSVHSGYTPREHWQYIESRLHKVLDSLYDLRKSTIADHLPYRTWPAPLHEEASQT